MAHPLTLLSTPLLAALAVPGEGDPAVEAGRLEALVRSLCTVETAGRETTTEGYRVAAEVVAAELERTGVQPAGDDGYYQWVPLQRWTVGTRPGEAAPGPPRLVVTDADGEEHTFLSGIDFDLPLGGFNAPPDSGEWEVLVVDSPEELPDEADPTKALFFTGGVPRDQRAELLSSKGQTLGDWGLYIDPRSSFPGREEVVPAPFLCLDLGGEEPGDLVIVKGAAKPLFLEERAARVRLDVPWKREDTLCVNLVGVVPGVGTAERPELAEEVVVLTANLDHMGVGSREQHGSADRTFDGADNNATAVAALLEVAEALVAEPPPRTVLLLFATGEEQGQLGVQWQLRSPALPLASTKAVIEVYALGRPDPLVPPPGGLWCTSFTETTVGPALQQADLPILMDERPRWHYDVRSSSNRYRALGIVGHRLSSYGSHRDLYSPRDEPDLVDFAHLERVTRTLLAAVRHLTDGSIPIEHS